MCWGRPWDAWASAATQSSGMRHPKAAMFSAMASRASSGARGANIKGLLMRESPGAPCLDLANTSCVCCRPMPTTKIGQPWSPLCRTSRFRIASAGAVCSSSISRTMPLRLFHIPAPLDSRNSAPKENAGLARSSETCAFAERAATERPVILASMPAIFAAKRRSPTALAMAKKSPMVCVGASSSTSSQRQPTPSRRSIALANWRPNSLLPTPGTPVTS